MEKDITLRIEKLIGAIQKLRDICIPDYPLKLEYLTIFSQDTNDFERLQNELRDIGEENEANNGKKYILKSPFQLGDENISLIRIRKPDVHRPELGCGDFKYTDEQYMNIRNQALEKGWDIIIRNGYEMIELSNFELPVYAYLVKDLK